MNNNEEMKTDNHNYFLILLLLHVVAFQHEIQKYVKKDYLLEEKCHSNGLYISKFF